MKKLHLILAAAMALGACGEQGGSAPAESTATPAAAPAAAAPEPAAPVAAEPAPPAAPAPEAAAPVTEDEVVTYDPIDVSKLEGNWYKQYSGGK